jgi:hypothetical protein
LVLCIGADDEIGGFTRMNGLVDIDEVARTLREYPGVHDVAVIVVGERLVAGVLAMDPPGMVDGLRAHAADRLPRNAVPSVWVVGPEVPLDPRTSKVDADRLRALCSGESAAPP